MKRSTRYPLFNSNKAHKTVLLLLIPLLLASLMVQILPNNTMFTTSQTTDECDLLPNSNAFPLDLETPVSGYDNDKMNSLGEIEITNFALKEDTPDPNFHLDDVINLNYVYDSNDFDFLGTSLNASDKNADKILDNYRSSYVTILLSEEVKWEYNENVTHPEVGFEPYFQSDTQLISISMNGTESDEDMYYTIRLDESGDDIALFYFNLTEYIDDSEYGEVILVYSYEISIPIDYWSVSNPIDRNPDGTVTNTSVGSLKFFDEIEGDLTQVFYYNVTFGNNDLNLDALARFKIYFPDHDYLKNLEVGALNGELLSASEYELEDFSLEFDDRFDLKNFTTFGAQFEADYTIEFIDTSSNETKWFEDRLVDGLDVRERDYKLSVTQGPPNLKLQYFGFNTSGIWSEDLPSGDVISSELERNVYFFDLNDTFIPNNNSLINETVYGLNMLISPNPEDESYYLFPGEVDKITLKYIANSTLIFIVADNIKVPLENMQAKIYFGDLLYGTRFNKFLSIPIGTKTSNAQGEISLNYVPRGEYRVDILKDDGSLLNTFKVYTTNSAKQNLCATSIPHFPQTILIFGGFCTVLLISGFLLFRKNRK